MSALAEQRGEADQDFQLAGIVAQLRSLRVASQKRRYRGAPPQLPSRKAMIDAIDGLVAGVYPRHFGPSGLDAKSIDAFVGRALGDGLRTLEAQIRLELALASEDARAAAPEPRDPRDMIEEFAVSLPNVRALADTDLRAGFDGDPSARSIDEIVFCFPGFAAILRHRLAHRLYQVGAPMLARIVAEDAHSQTGIDIHPGAEIGERFFIDHGTGVVIGETAVIGRNVRLYQAVTLGAKRFDTDESGALRKNYPRHPIVEDDVVIYAGATVLGRVTVGRGSSIGGNVWLTQSVPPNSNITQAKARNESFDNGAGI